MLKRKIIKRKPVYMLFNIVLAQLLLVLVCPVKILIHAYSDWLCPVLEYSDQLALHLLKKGSLLFCDSLVIIAVAKKLLLYKLNRLCFAEKYTADLLARKAQALLLHVSVLYAKPWKIGAHLTKRCLASCYVQITQILVI